MSDYTFRHMRISESIAVRRIVSLLLLASAVIAGAGCGGQAKKKASLAQQAQLRDETMTRQQLEELSDAFADRYYTLMLGASERVMRDNPSVQERRIMNGLRLLSVSSMYDIATSPDILTQLVDQIAVVTLQNYFWVNSGRARSIWEDRAIFVEQALRKAREDAWELAARVFNEEQLEDLDLLISNWWYRRGGTSFVAYVRFAEIATKKGENLIEEVRGGGGLLEPIDRATEQVEQANLALQRSFFWAKRVPLFANWQVLALTYEYLAMPEVQTLLTKADAIGDLLVDMPGQIESKGALAKEVMAAAGQLMDKAGPLTQNIESIARESTQAMERVNRSLELVQAMQAAAGPPNPAAGPPPTLDEYGVLLEQVRQNLFEANRLLETTGSLTDQRALEQRLKPIESLVQMRIREIQGATDELISGIFVRVTWLLIGVGLVGGVAWLWARRKGKPS
jgi:hypothetical protein